MPWKNFYRLIWFVTIICSVTCEQAKDTKDTGKSKNADQGHDHRHHLPHRFDDGQHWLFSFVWNIVGYSVVIIPGVFLIRMVKISNFYEKEGEGALFRMVQCCVFGTSRDSASVTPQVTIFRCFQGTSSSTAAMKLIFCITGLQISYLTWGVLQEKVMTHSYGEGVRFHNSEFLVFTNRVLALVVAASYVLSTGPNWSGPFYKFSYSSLSNICSSWCQYEALKYVSFPTQVLGKTSKMIPVMLMGKCVSRKSYQYYEYVVAAMISLGVSLFLLSTASDKHTSAETTISGLVLMIGYMGFDSFTSNWQSKLFGEYKVSSMQMMLNINTFSALFTIVPLLLNGGMISSISFMMEYPSFARHVFIISLTSAIGQLFIFYTIGEFGPLVFTTIMVTRQMFSILLSCLIYGHYLAPKAVVGVAIVFVALFLQIYAKYRIKQKERSLQNARQPADMT